MSAYVDGSETNTGGGIGKQARVIFGNDYHYLELGLNVFSFPLAGSYSHYLALSGADLGAAYAGFYPAEGSGSFAADFVWGVNTLPGSNPFFPIPSPPPLPDNADDLPDPPVEVSGAFLINPHVFKVPVGGEYGTEDSIYFAGSLDLVPTASDSFASHSIFAEGATALGAEQAEESSSSLGYFFGTYNDSPLFASFRLTDLDPERVYTATFADVVQEVRGGDVIDFTAHNPAGVASFVLAGLDALDGGEIPHVFGLTFAHEGNARFVVGSLLAVPEPRALILALCGGLCLIARRPTTHEREMGRKRR